VDAKFGSTWDGWCSLDSPGSHVGWAIRAFGSGSCQPDRPDY
jgi:hypothetical protein